MIQEEPQISDSLMGLAMEYRFHVIDAVRTIRPKVIIPQLRAGAGHHRSFSIVPGGKKKKMVHHPTTRKRTYEFFVISVMELHEAMSEDEMARAAKNLGGIAPSNYHSEKQDRFTGDTDADPFRGHFSLGALYEVATAIRRGGNIPEETSMEFEADWKGDQLNKIIIHLSQPNQIPEDNHFEKRGKRLDILSPKEANDISHACLDQVRSLAEERFRISPASLEAYISLDKTGTQVYGIGLRRWLD